MEYKYSGNHNLDSRNLILENMQEGVLIVDSLGRIEDINRAAREMTGLLNIDVVGQLLENILPEWNNQINLKDTGSTNSREIELLNPEGKKYFKLNIAKIPDQEGGLSGHLILIHKSSEPIGSESSTQKSMSRLEQIVAERTEELSNTVARLEEEIFERQRIEEGLRDSEEKMQSIFRVAPTGIGVVKNRVLLYVNPKICEMIGYSQEELIGKSARMLYATQEEFEFVGREKYMQIAKHDTGSVETVWQKKDGSLINIILASTPIDLNDLTKGVTFTALDITDRKVYEKALRSSEERYRKIFEASEIGISTNDLNGHFTSGNPALLKMFGYTLEEYCKLTIKDISHPEDAEKDLRLSEEMLAGKRPFFTIDKRNRHKNGHYIWGQLTSMLVRDGTGNPLYVLGMFEDITKRKEALEALHEREKFIQTVIDTVPVGIFVVDKEGEINYLNPTGQKIWQGARFVGVDGLDIYKGWRISDGYSGKSSRVGFCQSRSRR